MQYKQIPILNARVGKLIWKSALVVFALVLFFFAINFISVVFKSLSFEVTQSILYATSNPYIGLFIGLLLTAIIQSSSTSTSMIVAIVATGALSVNHATPMIMGANIGTTLTSSLIALSYVTNKKTFRRAISAGVIHDFFNILLTLLLLPLELIYGILSKPAISLGHFLSTIETGFTNDLKLSYLNWLSTWSEKLLALIPLNSIAAIVSFVLLVVSIKFLSQVIFSQLIGKSKQRLNSFLFKNTFQAFSSGLLITSAVQSSSVTTSLIVPLIANRKISLKNGYPFIVGANLGTTITALLAAIFRNEAAISIALLHLLFNAYGLVLLMLTPYLRNIPLRMAKYFGGLVQRQRYVGFMYIIILFFLLPFSLIYFNKDRLVSDTETDSSKIEQKYGDPSTQDNSDSIILTNESIPEE